MLKSKTIIIFTTLSILLSGCKVQPDMQRSIKLQKVISNQTFIICRCLANNSDLLAVYESIMNMNSQIDFNDSDNQMTSTDLDNWVGEYKFSESASEPNGPFMMMDYEVEIYKKNDNYYADIAIDGQTTLVRAKARVEGNEDSISLRFLEYLPEHRIGLCSEINDVLISFGKENENIYTYWGEIGPMLYKNEESGKVYFIKEADHIPEELPAWLGEYTFSEVSNNSEYPFKRLDYRIRIYQDNDQFFAEVQIDEEKPYVRLKAEVRGNKDEIRLRFIETLPEDMIGKIYDEGFILLKFKKEDGELRTDWGGIVPMVEENREFGKVYFEKAE